MEERRGSLRRSAVALIGASWLCGAGEACELPPGARLESERLAISYRTVPAEIGVGEQFEVMLAVCPKKNFNPSGEIKADASMPEHKHGMNYRPSVAPLGAGRYRSQGWLFHMPGRWEFVFEVGGERLTDSVRIE
ncbi:MAG: hypothetical protein AB1452_04865 [Pseudomonadota bacterium]